MSVAPELLGSIYSLTRGDLENTEFPLRSPVDQLRGMAMTRLARLSLFWVTEDERTPSGLDVALEELAAGFHAQRCSWRFVLRGRPDRIECWIAADGAVFNAGTLGEAVQASLPDARVSGERFDSAGLDNLSHGLVITGTPGGVASRPEHPRGGDRLEKLCRALSGHDWLYIVAAEPVEASETSALINDLAEQVGDARTDYLLRASPIDEQNRVAQRYVSLLEAKLERFEAARAFGLWRVRAQFYCADKTQLLRAVHALQGAFASATSLPDPIRIRPCSASLTLEPYLEPLTGSELSVLARPPAEDYPGYELVEYVRFGVEPPRAPAAVSVSLGQIVDRGRTTGNSLNVSRADLAKHGLIVGVTGSGKTNTCFQLLDQVWDGGAGVPFLVIESAKSEYRALLANPRFAGLRVFTVGDETLSPLRLNPLASPAGILVQTHIDYVKALFAAAFVLYPPMPYVLEQSLEEIYVDRGWDLARNSNLRGPTEPASFPTLDDLAAKVGVVVERMGYETRITMDVKAGLLARINQLRASGGKGRMFNTRASVSADTLFDKPCVIELKQVVSDDEKAFVIGLLLIRLLEHRETQGASDAELRHLTLIEEAHRLLRHVAAEGASDVAANPRGQAVATFANILSEIRSYGEGVVVAEQIPSKLTPDIVKNSALKIIHRLVAPDDRALMGGAVNLDAAQTRRLATLSVGEAVAWTEQTRKAVLIEVPRSPAREPAASGPAAVRDQTPDPAVAAGPFPACSECPSGDRACALRRLAPADPRERAAWRRTFNAMRFAPNLLAEAFAEFAQVIGQSTGDAIPAYCAFVTETHFEVGRRGDARQWPHVETAAAIAQIVKVAHRYLADDTSFIDDSEAVAMSRLEANEVGPFPGCQWCERPCQYRLDMDDPDPELAREFAIAFARTGNGAAPMVDLARQAAARSYPAGDRASSEGAAFCFLVQRLASAPLAMSLHYQREMARMLKGNLVEGAGA